VVAARSVALRAAIIAVGILIAVFGTVVTLNSPVFSIVVLRGPVLSSLRARFSS
jgi:hypothetical protein